MTDETLEKQDPRPRKMSRETRRQQLIESTIETLALRGYASTTLTEVARTAGLSHGLVNFHFESKAKLLAETLQFLAEEYRLNWMHYLDLAPPDRRRRNWMPCCGPILTPRSVRHRACRRGWPFGGRRRAGRFIRSGRVRTTITISLRWKASARV